MEKKKKQKQKRDWKFTTAIEVTLLVFFFFRVPGLEFFCVEFYELHFV